MSNASILAAFERMWQHIVVSLGNKADRTDIVQSDWLQTDENATDYIKNKPEIFSNIEELKSLAILQEDLLDTVSGYETIDVDYASSTTHNLNVSLSSETITDFSGITVTLTSDGYGAKAVIANADGSVTGLHSVPSFTLSLHSGQDISDVLITCTYQLDLDKIIRDYILHVNEGSFDGETGEGGVGSNSVFVDTTLSIAGAAADAKATGDAINSKVPVTRTINGKQLNKDIVLTAEDIGVVQIETDSTLKVSGKAADAKATGDAINEINNKLEDIVDNVYIQNDEPDNAPNGSIWIDLNDNGLPTSNSSAANVYVVDAATTDITNVDFSMYTIGDVVLITTS